MSVRSRRPDPVIFILQFPSSGLLRRALSHHSRIVLARCLRATTALRLAGQWSPQQWATDWSPREVHEHRVRVYVRCLLEHCFSFSSGPHRLPRRLARCPLTGPIVPQEDVCNVPQPPPDLSVHWQRLRKEATATAIEDIDGVLGGLGAIDQDARRVWDLLPGITVLQQLVQPLIEALILVDRVWRLRESPRNVDWAGLVRLFDPRLSPRCMVLMAHKRTTRI